MTMKLILTFMLSVLLIGCANNVSQNRQVIEERQQALEELKNDAIEDHIDELPGWVTDTHEPDDVGIYAVGMGESFDLSLAMKKARLEAEFNLAKAYAQELSGTEKIFSSEKFRAGTRFEGVIEKIVDKVPVVGYKVIEQKVKAIRGKYAVFVLMQLPYEEFNVILNQKNESVISKEMDAAFKELERRLDKRMKAHNKTSLLDEGVDKIKSMALFEQEKDD
ncbi:MAG: hypothetical protein QM504_11975 [Pseudomonadota bacterium]